MRLGDLFVDMALLYSWATPEYLLWKMSIGQIILYHKKGIDIKYGTGDKKQAKSLVDMSEDELRKLRDNVRAQFEQEKASMPSREELAHRYGDIGDGK